MSMVGTRLEQEKVVDSAGLERLSGVGHRAVRHALAHALSVMAVLATHAAAQTEMVAVFEDDLMPASLSHEVPRARQDCARVIVHVPVSFQV